MKQAIMGFCLMSVAIIATVIVMASNFATNKETMFEKAVSDSMYKSLKDMCFVNPDLSYEQILNGYITNLALSLNGTNQLKVDVVAIDKDYGIIDTRNELSYNDFFNNEKTITLRKTIIHNPEIGNDFWQVDFVVGAAFKGALFVKPNTTVAQALDEFGYQADWNLGDWDLSDRITADMTIYAN